MPTTGDRCDALTGQFCDYPNADPVYSITCVCTANADAATGSTWTCIRPNTCPASQPAYPTTCNAVSICAYASARDYCTCLAGGTTWICDWPWLLWYYGGTE
jgi:hypothetical protein